MGAGEGLERQGKVISPLFQKLLFSRLLYHCTIPEMGCLGEKMGKILERDEDVSEVGTGELTKKPTR